MNRKHLSLSAAKQGLLLILIAMYCAGCPGAEMPNIDIQMWAGDSSRSGITRSQEEKTLSCEDPQFDEFVCLTYEDLKKMYSTMLRCKKWGEVISEENTKKFIDKNPDVHHKIFIDKASSTI